MREVRKAISAEFGDDPEKLVLYYIAQQERHRDRLLHATAPQEAEARTDSSRRR